jgi:sarcosine oxidase subunit gamma
VVTTRFGDGLGHGPDEWLLVGTDGTEAETVAALGRAVGEDGAVVDLSAARTGLLLAGPAAREVLATCCPLDLHLKVFGPGRCAGTVIAKAPVILQAWEQPAGYRILVRPSYAAYVAGWLIEGLESIRDLR